MSKIVDQLRDRAKATKAGDPLCKEAARLIEGIERRSKLYADSIARLSAEIERLRNGASAAREMVTLTDEEREAIELAASACGNCNGFGGDPTRPAIYRGDKIAATLRNLLERLPT